MFLVFVQFNVYTFMLNTSATSTNLNYFLGVVISPGIINLSLANRSFNLMTRYMYGTK